MDPVTNAPASIPHLSRAHRAALEFEAVFLGQMTRLMMETATPEGERPGGHGEEMFRGILAETLGREMAGLTSGPVPARAHPGAETKGMGIANQVMAEIIRVQKGQKP